MALLNVAMLTDTQHAFSLILSEAVVLKRKRGGECWVSSSKYNWEILLWGVEVGDKWLVDELDLVEVSNNVVYVLKFIKVAKRSIGHGTRKPLLTM